MKIGYMPDTHSGAYNQPAPLREKVAEFCDQLLAEGEQAERFGFDGVFFPERHARTECVFPPPLVIMAALAARTRRIKLGTMVLQPPLYNPMHLAEDVAMIDNLSRGRVVLGIGMGYHDDYFNLFGAPKKWRFSRFEESVTILRGVWSSGERYSFHGKRFDFDNVIFSPKPYQPGGPPLWIGAAYPEAIARAGRLGDAWAVLPFWDSVETLKTQAALYREAAAKVGRTPRVVLMRDAWVAPSQEEAERVFGPLWVQDMLFYFRWGLLTPNPEFRSEADFTVAKLKKFLVLGDPQTCVDQIGFWSEVVDADYVVLRCRVPLGPSRPQTLECIQLFGEEVLPKLK
jgi:alkanesulfonate monooxygenase SsuD/methylene tetrahydromethanopterin reductase-like flavin-dependent oxidoreductase (luciferase family)